MTEHKHSYRWRTDGLVPPWRIFAECRCGLEGSPVLLVYTGAELQDRLLAAFKAGQLSALSYFNAPVFVPFDRLAI